MGWMDGIMTFISFILAFAFILGLAYLTTRFVASASFKKYKNKNMRLLEGMSLGPQKTLQLIKVGKKIVLLGVSKDGISKIETFSEDELEVSIDNYDNNTFNANDLFNKISKPKVNKRKRVYNKANYSSKRNGFIKRVMLNKKDNLVETSDSVNLESLNHHLFSDTRNEDGVSFNEYFEKALKENETNYDDNELNNELKNESIITSNVQNEVMNEVRTIKVGYNKDGDFNSLLSTLNKK